MYLRAVAAGCQAKQSKLLFVQAILSTRQPNFALLTDSNVPGIQGGDLYNVPFL